MLNLNSLEIANDIVYEAVERVNNMMRENELITFLPEFVQK